MAQAAAKPLTLTEVATRTKISMPTLQRYKKLYQARIPSEGAGRKQRYPEAALAVFLQLKKENIGRRGRPRKNAAPSSASPAAAQPKSAKRGRKVATKKTAASAAAGDGLLTLTQVASMTGISYPTLLRYVKTNIKDIPHKGTGRARRYKPEAVAVFKSLRQRSKRGRKPKAASAGRPAARKAAVTTARRRGRPAKVVDATDLLSRIVQLEKDQRTLERLCAKQQKQIDKPYKVVLKR